MHANSVYHHLMDMTAKCQVKSNNGSVMTCMMSVQDTNLGWFPYALLLVYWIYSNSKP